MDSTQWPAEWLKGPLTPAVLAIVAEGETYGYLIAQRLVDGGLGTVKGGTLYPLLARLEQEGLVAATWREGTGGPGRKYYAITPPGSARLRDLRADWGTFAQRVTTIIDGKARP